MPIYDRLCPDCGHIELDVLEPIDMPLNLCSACGAPMERAWLTKPSNVIGDEMDHVQVNGLKHPRRFRSKQEHKRWLKENHYRIVDSHVGDQGSDKNKHTVRWATGGKQWLKDAEILATRNGLGSKDEEPPVQMNIRTYTGDATVHTDGSVTLREHGR